ncbi:hydrogenase expression/formation protein HupK [Acidimangrovimonas pyrenivorans]|uniref:Hydrogenase expression/formation protein HupK n=1 Tax=Acidimangrovimonas pyrenivorans TaxID=2030798 RepID=A0ABV7AJP3_9RHOB
MEQGVIIALAQRDGHLAATVTGRSALPVERLILGRPVAEAAETLPRLFNLCRAAQEAAARLALELPPLETTPETLRGEILREHLRRLLFAWPRRLDLPARPLPRKGDEAVALFGPSGRCPATPDDFAAWRAEGQGTAPLLSAIAEAFAPGEAGTDLPATTPETAFAGSPQENATAGRHPGQPLLTALAASHGKGPLWRAAARLVDAEACLTGPLPAPRRLADGTAVTPAARGLYAIRAQAENGRVTHFQRVTPTDHLLAPGGALQASLASLPAAKAHLAPLVVDILDPCLPYELREVADA